MTGVSTSLGSAGWEVCAQPVAPAAGGHQASPLFLLLSLVTGEVARVLGEPLGAVDLVLGTGPVLLPGVLVLEPGVSVRGARGPVLSALSLDPECGRHYHRAPLWLRPHLLEWSLLPRGEARS